MTPCMGMQYQQGDYTVVTVAGAPADVQARFAGRRFTRQQLEEMGVIFQGDRAFVRDANGRDWELDLSPGL